MACFSPIRAFRRVGALDCATGKWPLTFRKSEGWKETFIDVPCGKCEGCRMDQARSWALRCMHEAACHEANCVVTLTYDDEHLPPDGELDKRGLQNWLKILRSRIGSFRYYGCGEYGSKGDRPHYHIILFGYDFPDKVCVTSHLGHRQYDSKLLRDIWPYGHISVGEVSFASAAYIARYCFKKQKEDSRCSKKQKEYVFMSLKPGIGADYAKKFGSDFSSAKGVIHQGKVIKLPKYYEKFLSDSELKEIKLAALEHQVLESPLRTQQRWQFAHNKLQNYKRSFEDA